MSCKLLSTSRCRAYDCDFATLAQRLGVSLITADRALLAAFPDVAQSLHQATS